MFLNAIFKMSSIFVKHFELPCVERWRCYINKLALPCLTSRTAFKHPSICPPLSGGVAGAEGAAHRPPGGAGDDRQHRGAVLFKRLLRHGAARTGGQIFFV